MPLDASPALERFLLPRAGAILLVAAVLAGSIPAPARGEFILAGEPVAFDADLRPRFTESQKSSTAGATRAGLERWAGTTEGQSIIRRAMERDRSVLVREDTEQASLGRAPQPGLTTLLAARDQKVAKRYTMILNPAIAEQYHNDSAVDLGRPRTETDAMALAWAAEMLHIDFYAAGVALPHHERADFQERWRAVVAELGFPNAPHGSGDE